MLVTKLSVTRVLRQTLQYRQATLFHSTYLLSFKFQLFGALTWSIVGRKNRSFCLGFLFYPSTGAILLFFLLISISDRSGLQEWASGVELVVAGGLPILNTFQACLLTFCSFLFHTALI